MNQITLIDATPAPLAAHLRYTHDGEDEISPVFAGRGRVGHAAGR